MLLSALQKKIVSHCLLSCASSILSLHTIVIDGNLDDWAGIREASSYPYPPEGMLHIKSVWAADDGEYLYAAVLFSSSIYDSAVAEIFIDADSVYETGSGSKHWRGLPVGAE